MTQNKELKSREDFECLWHLIDCPSLFIIPKYLNRDLMVLISDMHAKLTNFKLLFIA